MLDIAQIEETNKWDDYNTDTKANTQQTSKKIMEYPN